MKMKPDKQKLLHDFLRGIPCAKRKLNPDYSHPMDYKRLIMIVIELIEQSETIDIYNIVSECESIGEEYSILLKHKDFEELFCAPILSEIYKAKDVIETYLSIKNSL